MVDPVLANPGAIQAIQPAPIQAPAPPPGGGAFASVFAEAVARVEAFRTEADQSVARFLSGEDEEVHKVAMAVQRADLAFDMVLQAKNKVVQAYQEVMRMQL
jgi:flagellar hook-basal body complex protein FliE